MSPSPHGFGKKARMIPRRILESASIKELYRFMIENRLSRKVLFSIISKRLYQDLVVLSATVWEDEFAAPPVAK